MYLNKLAPWEEKKQYHQVIRLGNNLREQTEALKSASQAQVRAQLESANSIIASNEYVSSVIEKGLDELSVGINDISNGLYGLRSAFEWGISEVVWQIEQSNKYLRDILEVLMAPLDTKAKELKRRAEDAYSNGWYEDALEDFSKSRDLNRYDFTIHISIGMIYLFHATNKTKALESFDRAIKYSRPKSDYHTSYALLYKALILFDKGDVDEAEKTSSEAIQLIPNFLEAIYQNAVYNATLNNGEKSLRYLKHLFTEDANYVLKANSDNLLDPLRRQVNELIVQIKDEKLLKINKLLDDFNSVLSVYDGVVTKYNSICKKEDNIEKKDFDSIIKEVKYLIKLNSFFDANSCYYKIKEILIMLDNVISETTQTIQFKKNSNKRKIEKMIVDEGEKFKKKNKKIADNFRVFGSFIGPSIWIYGLIKGLLLGISSLAYWFFAFIIGLAISMFFDRVIGDSIEKSKYVHEDTDEILKLKEKIIILDQLESELNKNVTINTPL